MDEVRWKRAHYDLLATHDSTGEFAAIVLLDSASRPWPVRTVPAPVQHVFWLDSPPADSATKAGLRKAFDEAALYDGQGSVASLNSAPYRLPATSYRLSSYRLPSTVYRLSSSPP